MLCCIADVEAWCQYRVLKLNADKSEVLWLGTRQQIAKLSPADKDLALSTGTLSASSNERNLGVTVDENLTFDVHAGACSRACSYHLRCIRQVRQFLDEPETRQLRQLVHAYVTSCLGYCNALFSICQLHRRSPTTATAHSEQRRASHLLTASLHRRYAPSTKPTLAASAETYRLQTVCADVWRKARFSPSYLADLCNVRTDERLRSTSRGDFVTTRTRTRTTGVYSAFMVAAPSAWNASVWA